MIISLLPCSPSVDSSLAQLPGWGKEEVEIPLTIDFLTVLDDARRHAIEQSLSGPSSGE